MSLSFDSDLHEYRFGGVVVPGVTSLLQQLHSFAGVPMEVMDRARDRGTDVHLATELFDLGELDEAHLAAEDPEVMGYVRGWKCFVRDCAPNWSAIEAKVYHPIFRYAGTLDRNGDFDFDGQRVLDAQVDIKTSAASHPVWGVQTAAYSNAQGKPKQRRFTVQLRPEGTYRILEWPSPDDWPVFVSLVTLNSWKKRHGV